MVGNSFKRQSQRTKQGRKARQEKREASRLEEREQQRTDKLMKFLSTFPKVARL